MKKIILILSLLVFVNGCFSGQQKKRESITEGRSPKTFFIEAKDKLSSGAFDDAVELFEQLQAAYPASKYALQAKLETIYALYKNKKYAQAIDSLNSYIELYPNHVSTPYAYYLRGVVSEDKSSSFLDDYFTDNAQRDIQSVQDAFNYYLILIKKFPKSEYADEAKSKLVVIRNILARHELFVAIFYTKKQAYISAINRCKYIIEKFPHSPSVPAALDLIAKNYDFINAKKLAEDARRVLISSYPKYIAHYSLEK